MPQTSYPRDRFDDVPRDPERVGAHRAPRGRHRWLVVLLWWLLAVGILTGGGILAFLALSNTGDFELPAPPTASEVVTETPVPEADTSYPVLVLNGTDDVAAADAVRQEIVDAGWSEDTVAPLDSDASDVAATRVLYVGDEDEQAARGLAGALGISEVTQDHSYAEMSENGLTVIVGLDRVGDEF
ncbi:MAG: LytR C-terminal domain-containing protein [Microbacterium gubbeenense]|uniref:LytR C-terminal domain-containing protein n=1 Tax=Microbacterium gubbeenense TaxID=159896 RepID=UPI003F9C4514